MNKEQPQAVVAFVTHEGNLLLGKKDPASSSRLAGLWHILGEKIESNETPEQAVIRGVWEEARIEVTVIESLGFFINVEGQKIEWYHCHPVSTDLMPGSDLIEAQWAPLNKITEFCSIGVMANWPAAVLDFFEEM